MSTVAATAQRSAGGGGVGVRGRAAALERLATPAGFIAAGAVGLAFVALFFRWLLKQYGPNGFSAAWPDDWGHAYIVPLIGAYYVYVNRAAYARLRTAVFWPGLAVMVFGIASYLYFVAGYSNHMFQGAAMILTLAGLVMLVLGPHVFRASFFPIAYLGFAVTISEMVMIKVTWALKLLASKGSWVLLNMVGIQTDLEGNVLRIFPADGEPIPLNVADACSGMRMVVAFVALGVAVAFFSCREWWQRVAVILLATPVALLMNVLRVAVLGAASLWNPDLAVGQSHTLIGTLLLIPAFLLFMGCVWVLKQIVREDEPGVPASAQAGGGS